MTLREQIEALDAKATAGPWKTAPDHMDGQDYETCIEVPGRAGQIGPAIADFHHDWDVDRISWKAAQSNASLCVALRNAVHEILAALRLAETSSTAVPPVGAASALVDRVETSAAALPDVAGLVERLLLIAAWRKPGGPTPKKQMPSVYSVCSEAAATLTDQARRITELEAQLAGCDLIPEGNHGKLLSRIAELEKRLELDPEWGEQADGISCRDDTIKLQDERIAKLEAENARLREALEPFALMSSEGVVVLPTGYTTITCPAEYFHCASAALKGGRDVSN